MCSMEHRGWHAASAITRTGSQCCLGKRSRVSCNGMRLSRAGLVVSGTYARGDLVEIIELPDHPWFVAGQFHPEFKSRPVRPHPLFRDFVGAAGRRTGLVS